MSDPIFLTTEEVLARYRSQISRGTLRNWRSMRLVTWMSARLGSGEPDGWLCIKLLEIKFLFIFRYLRVSRNSMGSGLGVCLKCVLVIVPSQPRWCLSHPVLSRSSKDFDEPAIGASPRLRSAVLVR